MPDPDQPHVKNGATTKLTTILASGMTEFGYVYDFGDNWEHRIIVRTNLHCRDRRKVSPVPRRRTSMPT
jgi:hypothetical protein